MSLDPEDASRVRQVLFGRSVGAETFEFGIVTQAGDGVIRVATDCLVPLGGMCIHAATNAPRASASDPVSPMAAVPVTTFRHGVEPDGSQTLGFEIPTGQVLWFSLAGGALEALLQLASGGTIGGAPGPLEVN